MKADSTPRPSSPSLAPDPEATLVNAAPLAADPDPEATLADAAPLAVEEDPLVGSVVDGRYRVISLLGEGGMGRLYEVRHVVLEQRAVLKTILPKFARDPRVVARFLREARAASQIGSKHIVDVRDSGTLEDGRAYYVMEFLDGYDVRELLDDVALVDEARAIDIAIEVLCALEAAHSAGLVHRDLKPENIFLTRDPQGDLFAKVVDFGLVRFTEISSVAALTKAGELVGTPHYMSPEQCRGAGVDIRSDVYSLGLVLYEMVCGEVPYEEMELLQVVLHKTIDEWPPFAPLEKVATPELCAVLCRALVADPDKRFATPAAMRESLEAVRDGRSIDAARVARASLSSGSVQLGYQPTVSPNASLDTPAAHPSLVHPEGPGAETQQAARAVAARPSSMATRLVTVSPVRGAFASAFATFAVGAAVLMGLLLVVVPCEGAPASPSIAGAERGERIEDVPDAAALAPSRPPLAIEVPEAAEPTRVERPTAAPEEAASESDVSQSDASQSAGAPAAEARHEVVSRPRVRRHRAPVARPASESPMVILPAAPEVSAPTPPAAAPRPARTASDRSGMLNPWD